MEMMMAVAWIRNTENRFKRISPLKLQPLFVSFNTFHLEL